MVKIFGINISEVSSYKEAYNNFLNILKLPHGNYLTVNNVHTLVEALKNKSYKYVLANSILNIPDGQPLIFYAKFKGKKNISRIFGPTLLEKTLEWGQKDNLKHFFFGSSEETLRKMLVNIKVKYPNALIAGVLSPPFKNKFSREENEEFLRIMNESGADIFWIGLGAPKQEMWMYENYRKLNRGVMIGIGAGFDYLAGNIQHAPKWMKECALEWLYRLIQDPKRLWRRYLVSNTLFILLVFLELTGLKKFDQ